MLRELFPRWATGELWSAYHLLRRARHQELEGEDPVQPDEAAEHRLRLPRLYQEEHHYLEIREGRAVGLLTTSAVTSGSPEFESNRHLLDVEGWVMPAHRRQGIARGWVPRVLRQARARGATVVGSWSALDDGHAFLRRLGFEPRLTWRESRLRLASVDWALVRAWVEEGEARSPGSRLETYPHRLPEERLAEVATARTELENLVPTEDLDTGREVETADQIRHRYARLDGEGGASHDTCLVRDPDGSIAGLTDIYANAWEPALLRQDLTAVSLAARGRGVGKWLKAAMLELARERHPRARVVVTENARSNDAMLGINTRLGFRPHHIAIDYQIPVSTLAAAAEAPAG